MTFNVSKYCENTISSDILDIFKYNARIIINGTSFSGKTKLCIDLILKYSQKFDKIIIAESPNKNEFEDNLSSLKNKIEIYEHIPTISEIDTKFSGHKLIILDDNYTKAFSSERVLNFYTRGRKLIQVKDGSPKHIQVKIRGQKLTQEK